MNRLQIVVDFFRGMFGRRSARAGTKEPVWLDRTGHLIDDGKFVSDDGKFVWENRGSASKTCKTYQIADDGKSIMCFRCHHASYSAVDVEFLFCENCQTFHRWYPGFTPHSVSYVSEDAPGQPKTVRSVQTAKGGGIGGRKE